MAAGATGGGTDEVFFESDTNVTTNYTITSGKNAHTVSPVIDSGKTVVVPSGSLLVITVIMALNINGTIGKGGVDGPSFRTKHCWR